MNVAVYIQELGKAARASNSLACLLKEIREEKDMHGRYNASSLGHRYGARAVDIDVCFPCGDQTAV